jgi:hypothetical protein
MEQLELLQYRGNAFEFFNWAAAGVVTLLLLRTLRLRRHIFFKPSILTVLAYHILIQWPLAFYSPFIEENIPRPWEFSLLVHSFCIGGVVLGGLSFAQATQHVWRSVAETNRAPPERDQGDLTVLLTIALCLGFVYLLYVPIRETGLYALLIDPLSAVLAREASLKLLESSVPKYALSLVSFTIAPFVAALVAFRWSSAGQYTLAEKTARVGAVALVTTLAFLTGEKGVVVYIVLAIVVAAATAKGRFSWPWLMVGAALTLIPAIAVTLIFAMINPSGPLVDILTLQSSVTLRRAFVAVFEVSTWYVHYAQTVGTVGIAGVARLAGLAGTASIDVPNMIGLTYGPDYYGGEVLESISATAGFVFANYINFGALAMAINLGLLLASDAIIPIVAAVVARRLQPIMLVFFALSAVKFAQSEYMVVWLTHGFAVSVLAAGLLSLLSKSKRVAHPYY